MTGLPQMRGQPHPPRNARRPHEHSGAPVPAQPAHVRQRRVSTEGKRETAGRGRPQVGGQYPLPNAWRPLPLRSTGECLGLHPSTPPRAPKLEAPAKYTSYWRAGRRSLSPRGPRPQCRTPTAATVRRLGWPLGPSGPSHPRVLRGVQTAAPGWRRPMVQRPSTTRRSRAGSHVALLRSKVAAT